MSRDEPRVDAVASTGAIVALVGALLPFAEARPNRLVPGTLEPLAAAGWYALPLALAIAAAFVASLARSPRVRGIAAEVATWGIVGGVAWALGAASSRLLEGAASAARVSVGAGAWVLLVGAAVLGFAGRATASRRSTAERWLWRLLGIASVIAAVVWGGLDRLSLAREFVVRSDSFWTLVAGHLTLAGSSLLAGSVLGIPLGLWASRNRTVRGIALAVTGVIETVPSLALLGLLVVPLAALGAAYPALRELGVRGIGPAPGFIALSLYALLPIVRGTYVGLSEVDAATKDAGRGMGMNRRQLLTRVELPLAAPLIVDGVRTAAVLLIGITTLTVFAGARNLGILIFEGLGQFAPDLILLGALPTIVLAVIADVGLSALARLATPKGVRV